MSLRPAGYREVDLDLIEPAGVHRSVNQHQILVMHLARELAHTPSRQRAWQMLGSSQARTLIDPMTSGRETAGGGQGEGVPPAPKRCSKKRLRHWLTSSRRVSRRAAISSIAQPLRGEPDHLGPGHLVIRQRISGGSAAQLPLSRLEEHNTIRLTDSRHARPFDHRACAMWAWNSIICNCIYETRYGAQAPICLRLRRHAGRCTGLFQRGQSILGGGQSPPPEPIELGRKAGAQLAEQLAETIREMGMPRMHAARGAVPEINDII